MTINFKEQGVRNRRKGVVFEARVREDLNRLGWIVDKWMNVVDQDKNGKIGGILPAKRKYNPFKKVMVIGTGFPDFIAFKKIDKGYDVIGVEVKTNGYLDQKEKGMCFWLLENKIFSRILIAKKKKSSRRIEIIYEDFDKKYARKFETKSQ